MADPRIPVGRVVALHGVAGKIKVNLYSGDPSGVQGVTALRLHVRPGKEREERDASFRVLSAQRVRGCAVFLLDGIDSAESARGWIGAEASVLRSELPEPAPGEYYVTDLVGCAVVGPDGSPLGTVADVLPGPAHDWLSVRRPPGDEAFLPLVEAFVLEVDLPARTIRVSPPEGWSDAV